MVARFGLERFNRLHLTTLSRRTALHGLGGAGLLAALGMAAGAQRGAAQNDDASPAADGDVPPVFQAWLAAWAGDTSAAATLYAEDAVLEDVASGAVFEGREAVTHHAAELLTGFPDNRYELLSAFVAGDRAAAEFRWTATYTGTLAGLPPGTGQAVSLRGATVLALEDGRIVSEAHYYDAYGFLVQLGFLPEPGSPDAGTPAA